MKKLRFYKVTRYIFSPYMVAVFALDKEDALDIVTKKYGPATSEVCLVRIRRGLCIEEVGRR